MSLQPGTRGIVDVRPMDVPWSSYQTWSCSTCGQDHSALDSWVLSFRHDSGPEYDFVVCPSCARKLEPLRPQIDLARVEALPTQDELRDHIRQVLEQRSERPERYLTLRDADVRELAARSDTDARAYLDRLSDAGVLARRDEDHTAS